MIILSQPSFLAPSKLLLKVLIHFSICYFDEYEIVVHVLICIFLITDEIGHPVFAFFLFFFENVILFFIVVILFYFPQAVHKNSNFSTSSPTFIIF